ncbi:hypothetical protein [Metabacillus fastidiosus]|uniref:hypothetical protein n=1 Tax=Metabacillus fastidiosus TaxID=1458 RepID=UPI003D27882D
MIECRNDIRTNMMYVLYKIYKGCKDIKNPKQWQQENYVLCWDGSNTLKLLGTPYKFEVINSKVYLDDRVSHYYQVPCDWLRMIKEQLLE